MNASKHVYVVRHGESLSNATRVRQGPEAPLTERGKAQAIRVGRRIVGLSPERIVTSDFTRAKETAEIARIHTGHERLDHSSLFVERRNPGVMTGKSMDDPEVERIWDEIAKNYGIPGWRHSDEENFEDLIARAKTALRYLERLPHSSVVVISHGMFMKVLFAHILLGEHLNARTFWDRFVPMKNVANTGIMHLEYTDNYHGTGKYWKLHSWNDHAHLLPDLL